MALISIVYSQLKILIAVIIILAALPIQAKEPRADGDGRASSRIGSDTQTGARGINRLSSAEIETRFRPYFEERANEKRPRNRQGGDGRARDTRRYSAADIIRPSQKDLLILMHRWNDLTPEFRALYKEATAFPPDYDYFISPSGRFRIFYTTQSPDETSAIDNSVDATDTIGYGVSGQPSSWRERQSSDNGVPDYIDMVAFGLDSAWSMIVDRFGFPEPVPTPGPNGETDRYNIIIRNLNPQRYYGITYPQENRPLSPLGFPSHIEINSSWPRSIWGGLGYDRRPYDALLVTAAHEFMHSIQYAMVRTAMLDNLPIGWLEGAAVLMEELAFPDVNDYLQYIDRYFDNPRTVSLVSDFFPYLNGLLFKYLYEKTNPNDSIGLIRDVHFYNRDRVLPPFHPNIEQASQTHTGKSWAELLNAFHTESYFTGSRTKPGMFVSDAELMNFWLSPVRPAETEETRRVLPHSVELFRYTPHTGHPDTLVLNISGHGNTSAAGKIWAASVLVMERGGDSVWIAPVPLDQHGSGYIKLENWREKSGCLLIVTNADGFSERNVTVRMTNSVEDTIKNTPLSILPNVVKRGNTAEPVRITGGNINEVKIFSQDGKLLGYWNGSGRGNAKFEKIWDGTVIWYPSERLAPGVYFVSAVSTRPGSNKKDTRKRKIMVLP
jgi:hypothetical protein